MRMVWEWLIFSSPLIIIYVRARNIVLAGRSKRAEFLYRHMGAWVELYRMAKKAI